LNWRLKALAQTLFSVVPRGQSLNYLMQRHVTRSVPSRPEVISADITGFGEYLTDFARLTSTDLQTAVFYEFGAGIDLVGPLVMYCLGVNRQIVVDIRRLARPWLIKTAMQTICDLRPKDARRLPSPPSVDSADFFASLRERYGIDYLAPADARATSLADNCIDCVTSTRTLEHIPPADIKKILVECRRLTRATGLIISRIDYQDHYSYVDPSLTVYNFLHFSDPQWRIWNPALQYQNRLRHSDYQRLFEASGWQVIEERRRPVTREDLAALESVAVHKRFSHYDPEDLATRGAVFIARPRPQP